MEHLQNKNTIPVHDLCIIFNRLDKRKLRIGKILL